MEYPDFFTKGAPPCTQANPDDFFADPEQPGSLRKTNNAKKICKEHCKYIDECREYAIENNEVGVWGGTTRNERRRIKRERIGITNGGVRVLAPV